jgi:hypothetical protein
MKINYKEVAIYAVIAAAIVIAVVFILGKGLISSNYNVSIRVAQLGGVPQYPYQASHFLINITNNGQNQVNNLLVGFYLNGVSLNAVNVSIPAGKSVALLKNYTYQSAGNYSFHVIADPGQVAKLTDRQQAQNTISLLITQPQSADVYISIPNGNITDTQSFTMSGAGTFTAAQMAQNYNISLFNKLFTPPPKILPKIFRNLGNQVAYFNGAYVMYANNSTAYSGWLQGTINPTLIGLVVSSFGLHSSQYGNTTYAMVNNTTSICTWYEGGWTKILAYYNDSHGGTCLGFSGNAYNPSESQLLVSVLKSNSNLIHYQSGFLYTNITPLGSVLEYSNGNITTANLFNNSYGFVFTTSLKKLAKPLNSTVINNPKDICLGLIYNNGPVHVCSVFIATRNGSINQPYGLINSSEITSNYIINMYSLVNQTTSLVAAHENAARLMGALEVNETSVTWKSGFRNGCAIMNSSLQCGFLNFNYTSNNASINITNGFASDMRIDTINCELAPGYPTVSINKTIASNKTAAVQFRCYNLPVPSATAVTAYSLSINYTVDNTMKSAFGVLNVTNSGLAASQGS